MLRKINIINDYIFMRKKIFKIMNFKFFAFSKKIHKKFEKKKLKKL